MLETQTQIHYGHYDKRPAGIEELPDEYRRLHPLEFSRVKEYGQSFWTNNPYLADQFDAADCFLDGVALNTTDEWQRSHTIFTNGEIMSMLDWRAKC